MTDKTADPSPLPPTATLEFIEVIPYPMRRGWVLHYERHKTFRRSRRGPYRGLVQGLIEDKTRRPNRSKRRFY